MSGRRASVVLWSLAALVVFAGGSLLLVGSRAPLPANEGAAGRTVPEVGGRAPDFRLAGLAGERVRLADFRGKPVFLNFWTTWCTYCRAEFPEIERAFRDYRKQVVFLAINVGEEPALVRRYVTESGSEVPVLLDPEGKVAQHYLVQGLPTSYFIAADGTVRDKVIGAVDGPGLRVRLESLLR